MAITAGGDRLDAAFKTGNVDRGSGDRLSFRPELAVAVVAPALDAARGHERAAVGLTAGGDRGRAAGKAGDR